MTAPGLPKDPETALSALTAPIAPDRPVWREAINRHRPSRTRLVLRPWMGIAAAIAIVAIVGSALLPRLEARSARRFDGVVPARAPDSLYAEATPQSPPASPAQAAPPAGQDLAAASAPGPRRIARKAAIELLNSDVRATFSRVAMVVSEALGEFIESASLSGPEDALQGTLTLRVQQQRLDSVLARLRELGTVAAESAEGIDVTDRAVDLDATIRNELRVEREVLELLTSRQDAPLADILLLRRSLDEIRLRIERLQAQRDQLGRSVDYASVLVTLRRDDRSAPTGGGLGAHFADQMSKAWEQGVRALASTTAAFVRGFIGWLPGWIVVFTAIAILWRYARWLTASPAREPPPRL